MLFKITSQLNFSTTNFPFLVVSPSYSISSIPSTVFRIHFLSSYWMSLIPSKYIAKLCDLHRVFISHLYPLCPPTQIIALSTLTPFQMTDTAVLFSSPGNLPNKPFQNTREKISFIAFYLALSSSSIHQ